LLQIKLVTITLPEKFPPEDKVQTFQCLPTKKTIFVLVL